MTATKPHIRRVRGRHGYRGYTCIGCYLNASGDWRTQVGFGATPALAYQRWKEAQHA